APDRRMKPKATPMTANTAIDTAAARIGTTESAGTSQENERPRDSKIGVTASAAANEMRSEATNRNAASTRAFAASTEPRTGSAARVERIIPVPYSPVTAMAPRMPASSIVNWIGDTTEIGRAHV